MRRILGFLFMVAVIYGVFSWLRHRWSRSSGQADASISGRLRSTTLDSGRDLILCAFGGAAVAVLINVPFVIGIELFGSKTAWGSSLFTFVLLALLTLGIWSYPVLRAFERSPVSPGPALLSVLAALLLGLAHFRGGPGFLLYIPSALLFAVGVLMYTLTSRREAANAVPQNLPAET